MRLDAVRARAGRLDAVFAALTPAGAGGATNPTQSGRRVPTSTATARPTAHRRLPGAPIR
ncbi:hypothetical protein NKG94_10445 [Micromonospora sp. M12]